MQFNHVGGSLQETWTADTKKRVQTYIVGSNFRIPNRNSVYKFIFTKKLYVQFLLHKLMGCKAYVCRPVRPTISDFVCCQVHVFICLLSCKNADFLQCCYYGLQINGQCCLNQACFAHIYQGTCFNPFGKLCRRTGFSGSYT